MILDVEQAWGKHPGWFVTLDREAQNMLLAKRQIDTTPAPAKPPPPPSTPRGRR